MKAIREGIEALLKDLKGIEPDKAHQAFTSLFNKGCELLELDDQQAAKTFDTTVPNIRRWRAGNVVPPMAGLVLSFMREAAYAKIKSLERSDSEMFAKQLGELP